MKVLWFSPVPIKNDLTSGGWVLSLAKSVLKMKNIELHVAFRSNSKNIQNKIVESCNTWHIPSEEHSKLKTLLDNYSIRKIDKNIDKDFENVISRVNPDIIQVFGTESVLGRAVLNTKIPFVFHIQCIYNIYRHKYFSGLSVEDIKKYSSIKQRLYRQTFISNYHKKKEVVERENIFYDISKYFMGRTEWDRRCSRILSAKSQYFHCEEAMREIFFKNEWNMDFDGQKIRIITVIGGALYKGLETIIEAAELLKNKAQVDFEWKVFGLREDQESVMICRRKYGSRIKSNIRIMGRFNAEKIVDVLCRSDIYVHPSHIENSSNSICEALLLGMPVIATYTGGTPSLIENGRNGMLIQDGDPWSMAGAILEVYDNPSGAEQLGKKAREIALIKHDPDRIAANLIEIYKTIINQNILIEK